MIKTKIKFCGITNEWQATCALSLGVDWLGFMLYEKSKRYVPIEKAVKICQKLSIKNQAVGVFVNASSKEVQQVINALPLAFLQFHGDENVAFCEQFSIPYVKAIAVKNTEAILAAQNHYANAEALLLDTYKDKQYGGVGESFDWSIIPANLSIPIILAGGLTKENVAIAIKQVEPMAVDVSSGIESSAGVKDEDKMTAFVKAVRQEC